MLTCIPVFLTETTSAHSHCSHSHPHAEPAAPTTQEKGAEPSEGEGELSSLHARLDRLIAFLDSYFGQVELLQPDDPTYDLPQEEKPAPVEEPAAPSSPKVKDESELPPPPDLVPASPTPEAEVEAKPAVRAPIIRVRLDNHVADVVVEDLSVTSTHEPLQRRVESIIKLALAIVTPLSGDEVPVAAGERPAKKVGLEEVAEEAEVKQEEV